MRDVPRWKEQDADSSPPDVDKPGIMVAAERISQTIYECERRRGILFERWQKTFDHELLRDMERCDKIIMKASVLLDNMSHVQHEAVISEVLNARARRRLEEEQNDETKT